MYFLLHLWKKDIIFWKKNCLQQIKSNPNTFLNYIYKSNQIHPNTPNHFGLSKKMKALSISGLDFSLLSHCKSFCDAPTRNHFSIWNVSTWVYSSKVIRLLVSSLTASAFSFWKPLWNHPSPLIMKEHRKGNGPTSGQHQRCKGSRQANGPADSNPRRLFL